MPPPIPFLFLLLALIKPIHSACNALQQLKDTNNELRLEFREREHEHEMLTKHVKEEKKDLKERIETLSAELQQQCTHTTQILKLQTNVEMEIFKIQERIAFFTNEIEKKQQEEQESQDLFVRLAEESQRIQKEYLEATNQLAEHGEQTTVCSNTIQKLDKRRHQVLLEETILLIHWKYKLELIEKGLFTEALKNIGKNVALSVCLWASGAYLVAKGFKTSAKLAKWTFKIFNHAQAPAADLLPPNRQRRLKQVVEIHIQHGETTMTQFTPLEIENVWKVLQPDPNVNLELNEWKALSSENERIYDLCLSRMETMLNQDMDESKSQDLIER